MLRLTTSRFCATSPSAASTVLSSSASTSLPSSAATAAAALRLKCACNQVLAKYRDAPPDIFLRRARAYEDLGQPYFALGDYSMASENLQIDKEHVTVLMKQTAALPSEIRMTFPGTNTHLRRLVDHALVPEACRVKDSGVDVGGGRAIEATADVRAGQVLVKRHTPWLTYPALERHCANCGTLIGARIVACRNPSCHEEYCSRDCRAIANRTYHGGTCENQVFQTLELELYSKFKSSDSTTEQNEAALHLLAMRVISSGLTQAIKPTALAEMQTLSGTALVSPVQLATTTHEFHYRLCRAANVRMSLSLEEFMCLLCKIQSNLFQGDTYFYLSLPRSMINHSCDPNASELGGEIIATQPIRAGEEVTISYFPSLVGMGRDKRLVELKKRGFECACALCKSGK